jgi:hypothetical protein
MRSALTRAWVPACLLRYWPPPAPHFPLRAPFAYHQDLTSILGNNDKYPTCQIRISFDLAGLLVQIKYDPFPTLSQTTRHKQITVIIKHNLKGFGPASACTQAHQEHRQCSCHRLAPHSPRCRCRQHMSWWGHGRLQCLTAAARSG